MDARNETTIHMETTQQVLHVNSSTPGTYTIIEVTTITEISFEPTLSVPGRSPVAAREDYAQSTNEVIEVECTSNTEMTFEQTLSGPGQNAVAARALPASNDAPSRSEICCRIWICFKLLAFLIVHFVVWAFILLTQSPISS